MNDHLSNEQKYQKWLNAVIIANESGWKCVKGWIFMSPSETYHDLSSADLNKLDLIEEQEYFIIDPIDL